MLYNKNLNHFREFAYFRRQPKSLVKPMKILTEEDENRFNEKCDAKKSKAVRHIFLVRHGQYRMDGKTDAEMILTDLGTYLLLARIQCSLL